MFVGCISKLMMLFPMFKNDWGLGLGLFSVCLNNLLVLTHIRLNVLNWHMTHLIKISNKLVLRLFSFFLLFYYVNSCSPTIKYFFLCTSRVVENKSEH